MWDGFASAKKGCELTYTIMDGFDSQCSVVCIIGVNGVREVNIVIVIRFVTPVSFSTLLR